MNKADFFNLIAPMAKDTYKKYGVPASVTMAQAAIESRWGDSTLTKKANNFFGIRAIGDWVGKTFNIDTGEYINSAYIIDKLASFRSYDNAKQSFIDHADFLQRNPRYKHLFDSESPTDWANGLQAAGYATAPNYADTLKSVIKTNDLTKYDKQAKAEDTNTDKIKRNIRRKRRVFIALGGLTLLGLTIAAVKHYKANESK